MTPMFRRLVAWLVPMGLVAALGCAKPKPAAPTADFMRRHSCPESKVKTLTEGSDKMRVTGCGSTEVFVYQCVNGSSHIGGEPTVPSPQPDPEPRSSQPSPTTTLGGGCAWSRQRPEPSGSLPPVAE
jgi:hypothetical protein